MQALQKQTTQEQISRWTDLWFTEYKKAGYVAITDFNKQFFYGLNDVPNVIKATKGRKKQFISLNAFDVNWEEKEFSRQTAALKQIRNIAIDIDQYKIGLTINEALDGLQALIVSNRIPEPNLVLTSRGVQIFYSIDRGASPRMGWLVEYITDQLISKLKQLGADSNAKDLSRVMRVPNSINERNNALVKPYIWNDEAYDLQELQRYCRPLEEFETRKKKKGKLLSFNGRLALFYKTNMARRRDLLKLVDLRNGDMTNCRNVFTYMYAYHQSLVLNTKQDVIDDVINVTKELSSRDKDAERITESWIKKTTINAYNDAREFFNHYISNGYRIIYKDRDGVKKPYKTSNVIDKLHITESEQRKMQTLRSEAIKKEKHAEYMKNKRRAAGMKTRQEYKKSMENQQGAKITKLAILLEEYPNATHKELAELMGASTKTIQRFLKVINR